MKALRLAASILVVSVVACGGGGDNGNSTTGGASGSATAGAATGGSSASGSGGMSGSTTSAGNSSAGSTPGGSSSAGSGSSSTGAHCTPGTPQPAINFIGGTIDQCPSVSGLTGDYDHLLDIELPKPLGPGGTFAFSVDLKAPEGDFEVYGTTRECGDVGEKLGNVHVLGNGIICYALKPVTGTYTHLIWVWRVRAEMLNTALCEDGTCPGQ